MSWIAKSDGQRLPDVDLFFNNEINGDQGRHFFDPEREIVIARAPGRLDIMGGIADYSGSLVLEMPMQEATLAALQHNPEPLLTINTANRDRNDFITVQLADLMNGDSPTSYEAARDYFATSSARHWAAYIAGCWLVLMRERRVHFKEGARLMIRSAVPEGKGVSSSAAVEVATMQAICCAYGIQLEAREMALLCQKVENLVVGAACGVMDQMTATCGEHGRALALLCQPCEIEGHVTLPPEIEIWGIDSGIRHAVSGSDYTSVRIGAFMGYRIIADLAKLPIISSDPVKIDDPRWGGYLANISPSAFKTHYYAELPESMSGREFLQQYGGSTDSVTRIDPERSYAVRIPTMHPVYESFRVQAFRELLGGQMNERTLKLLGELMYQSHGSYSACGLGSSGTDLLVEMVRDAGIARGLYGAKITGGGSGGTVAVLAAAGSQAAIDQIVDQYQRTTGYKPLVFHGSSAGAGQFGCIHLQAGHS